MSRAVRLGFVAAWLALACLAIPGCSGGDGPPPTPDTGPGRGPDGGPGTGPDGGPGPGPDGGAGSGAVQINGSERIGWDQPAPSVEALQSYGYFIYVDGVPVEVAGASCASSAGANGFACSARLPPMTAGLHTLTLSAYVEQGGRLESARSGPLQVRLVTSIAGMTSAGLETGSPVRRVTTVDGVGLQVHVVATGLVDPTDLALTPDGRVFVAERAGRVRVVRDGRLLDVPALVLGDLEGPDAGNLLGLAVDPRFQETAGVYAVYTTSEGFRLVRFHAVGDALRNRAVLLDRVEAGSAHPSAVVRIGPDRKLYVAFDDGGDARQAGDVGSFSGKILRLNVDGTTPADQAGGTPVYAADVNRPNGLDWGHDGATLWVGERDTDGSDRLNAVAGGVSAATDRPTLAGVVRARYTLPRGTGASGAAFYWGPAIPAFQGNLFVAADAARAILRVRFESLDSSTIAGTEWILRDEFGPIRAVAVAPDGGLYFCTSDALMLITPEG